MNEPPSDTVLVATLRASLPDGELRFLRSSSPLRLTWFPLEPSQLQEFLSDYNTPDVDEPEEEDILRLEWRNEIVAITKILEEIDAHDPTLDQSTAEARFDAGLDRRARALNIWDAYGIPLRLRKQNVFRIVSPRDALGDPVILGVPLSAFIVAMSAKTAHDSRAIARLTRAYRRWRFLTLTLGLVFLALLLTVLS